MAQLLSLMRKLPLGSGAIARGVFKVAEVAVPPMT
jgi:hypothetical protein